MFKTQTMSELYVYYLVSNLMFLLFKQILFILLSCLL